MTQREMTVGMRHFYYILYDAILLVKAIRVSYARGFPLEVASFNNSTNVIVYIFRCLTSIDNIA